MGDRTTGRPTPTDSAYPSRGPSRNSRQRPTGVGWGRAGIDVLGAKLRTSAALSTSKPGEASTALVAPQCPNGHPVRTSYRPMDPLPADLRPTTVEALAPVLTEPSEILGLWEESDGEEWEEGSELCRLSSLVPDPSSGDDEETPPGSPGRVSVASGRRADEQRIRAGDPSRTPHFRA
ncbi:DUF4259 domain-containing protein [Streptomyces sp. NPDC006553]|uniref:DUF4259 domain-containing protein n=1 Tax=Streptomyces sp. NPDC006553 TaxID=3157180 RepID=UPI0033A8BDF3